MERRHALWKWSALAVAATMTVAGPAMLKDTGATQSAACSVRLLSPGRLSRPR